MTWQVTAAMVVVPADTQYGRQMVHVGRRGILPPGVPQEKINHLLSLGMIRKVGPAVSAPPAPAPAPAVKVEEEPPPEAPPTDSVPYDHPDRVAAREKLPAGGSLPDGRAAHAVWVEAAVRAGYAYDAARQATKQELQELLRR